ncbi:MAG: hypothetical protein KAS64_02155 [Spirochaetes bacterium]|nr:hypothetical protein [Spirochaetota bacterium]
MKSLRYLICMIVLLLFISTSVWAENPETILGFSTDYDKGNITIYVVSTGCTKKGDFRFDYKGNVLTIVRTRRDACKAMPEKISLTFNLKEVGIKSNIPFRISNKIVVNLNLAKM